MSPERIRKLASAAWAVSVKHRDGTTNAQIEPIAKAVRAAVAEALTRAADECAAVRREHKKSGSYPFDMGGLALECEERIRKLVRGEP